MKVLHAGVDFACSCVAITLNTFPNTNTALPLTVLATGVLSGSDLTIPNFLPTPAFEFHFHFYIPNPVSFFFVSSRFHTLADVC
jgi:hypothetical protein